MVLNATVAGVLGVLASVNSYFQLTTPVANNDWTGGVYMIGNMAAYRASGNTSLLGYAQNWGDAHKWSLTGYRGCHGSLGCPDNIIAGQGYVEVHAAKQNATYVASIATVVRQASQRPCGVATNNTQRKDSDACWWWVDALFMALPAYAKVAALTHEVDPAGADDVWRAARAQYNTTAYGTNTSGADAFNLWSDADSMFYRDDSFIGKKTPNGGKVFWARGVGWAFGAMARTLDVLHELPPSAAAARAGDRAEYTARFVSMAAKLKTLQGADGCWRPSLEDPKEFSSIETTGTSLFVFGMAWGVNNNILPASGYAGVAKQGWACLNQPWPTGAVAHDGRLGWCQPGGAQPNGNFNSSTTSDFCVGTFLLAGSEVVKMATLA